MKAVISIVEGDGEVAALPVLLRRLSEWKNPGEYVSISRPIRVRRDQFLNKEDVFSKNIQLAGLKSAEYTEGWILILLDADDDCPVDLAREVLNRVKAILPEQRVSVVLANREYEAWFLAAARSLDGVRGFEINEDIENPDAIRGAKEWLKKRNADRRYGEVTDQPALSAIFDIERASQSSRSFRKLCSEWESNFGSSSVIDCN